MISKSIRWRLQLWYGLILVAVLAGFGLTAFQMERGRVWRRVEDELHRRANALAGALRQPPRGRRPDEELRGEPPPESFRPPHQPRPGPPSGESNPDEFLPPPREFHLPTQLTALFDPSDPNGFYYVVGFGDAEWARSTNAPAQSPFSPAYTLRFSGGGLININRMPLRPADPRGPAPGLNVHGDYREIRLERPPLPDDGPHRFDQAHEGDHPLWIVVGRSVGLEASELNFAAWRLAVVGVSILLGGLAGGWWIANRAMRPLADISATAVKISAGDLSQRIPTAETESELGQLAGVLNATFARLQAAFAQQQQFTSDAAHELRTPVSVMLTQTQGTLQRERSPAEYRETLEACQRAAQRMRRLIESLLALARLDAGQESFRRSEFDLSQLAEECLESLRPLAEERKVSLKPTLAPTRIIGDPERLAQVVTNLLTNAIVHHQPGGEVRISLERLAGVASVTVSDDGPGISAVDLPHVFERFYRADSSRSTGGNGLGLAIVKAIVEAHGGTIDASSVPGQGATFTVRLPV